MRFTVQPTDTGKWQVIDTASGKTYGDPHDTADQASALAREAEAHFIMDRLAACPRADRP